MWQAPISSSGSTGVERAAKLNETPERNEEKQERKESQDKSVKESEAVFEGK